MIKKFLDLGVQPLANKYLRKKDLINKKENYYHLELGFKTKTKLDSILNTDSAKKMINKKYPYKSSISLPVLNPFKK